MQRAIESRLKAAIRPIINYPKEGVSFQDITPLLLDGDLLNLTFAAWDEELKDIKIDAVAAIEARGFIFGAGLAMQKKVGFIPIRKQGKLPAATVSISYQLEYGMDCLEIHKDAVKPNMRVVLIDDLIATGGTALAALSLLRKLEANVVAASFLVDLHLGGSTQLKAAGVDVISILNYQSTMIT